MIELTPDRLTEIIAHSLLIGIGIGVGVCLIIYALCKEKK